MANLIAYAENFASALDEKFEAESVTKFFEDPVMKAKFVGVKEVSIPEEDMSGLGNYDRNTGFPKGAITVTREVYKLKKDRAKTFSLDRMDADESGVADMAGGLMGRFVKKKVVPEADTYVISQIAGIAKTNNQTVTWDGNAPVEVFGKMLAGVQDAVGYDEEIVCFLDATAYSALKASPEFYRSVNVSEFKKGEISTTIRKIDNVILIPVKSDRMKDFIEFKDDEAGGYSTEGAKDVHMLMLPKDGAHLVKKTEKIRVFSPDQNQDMDAYQFDYRIYYDVFVRKSEIKGVWASFGE